MSHLKKLIQDRILIYKYIINLVLYYAFLGEVLVDFTHIRQGDFTGTGAIIRLPQCHWSNPEEYGQTSHINLQYNHSNVKQIIIVCIYCGINCITSDGLYYSQLNSPTPTHKATRDNIQHWSLWLGSVSWIGTSGVKCQSRAINILKTTGIEYRLKCRPIVILYEK